MTTRQRNFHKLMREKTPDRVKPRTLMISALTAITLAIISTKLVSFVNSIVLVGIASVLAALVSEFYRFFLEFTEKAISKAVKFRVEKRLGELTGELPVIEEEVIEKEQEAREKAREAREKARIESHSPGWRLAHKILVSRWAAVLVFAVVAFSTLGGNYVIGKQQAPEYHIDQKIVKRETISDSVKEELARQAAGEADEAANEAKNSAIASSGASIEELRGQLEELKASLANETAENEALISQIAALEETITTMQKQIAELEKDSHEPPDTTTTPDPTTP